jgi:hypothetical protein
VQRAPLRFRWNVQQSASRRRSRSGTSLSLPIGLDSCAKGTKGM